MSQQKVVITKDASTINEMINAGWFVISVTAQHVSVSTTSNLTCTINGEFCFILEK